MAKTDSHAVADRRYAARRRQVLRAARKSQPVDALLISDPIDIRYLCGVNEGSQSLLLSDDWAVIITNKMFQDRLAEECHGAEMIVVERGDGIAAPPDDVELGRQFKQRRLKKVGFEDNLVSLSRYRSLASCVGEKKLVPLPGLVVGVRAIKDAEEIALTRKAVQLAEAAFKQLTGRGADYFVGRTELQLAAELEYIMRMGGADRQAFPTNGIIVAAGPNSAACHHFPTSREVRRGDAVLFDWGAELSGYRSDITRVVFVGQVPEIYQQIYPVVEDALKQATAAVRPGVKNHKLDKIARGILEAAGHELRHGLGHGIGLQIHEQPRLTAGPARPLKREMIITIEPGIYIHGQGGVRLEDDILVTAEGHENLCSLPTAIDQMTLR
ncbi:MAG: aminopeptidase P family protein [Pirellulaceae bacterium]|nr:aminopeptidase P family protein [Pirellulaceae bacterium]